MSYADVYSEVLFWFVVVLTLLLVMFIGVVVRTCAGADGSAPPPEFSPPAPSPPSRPLLVRHLLAAGLVDAAMRPARAGYRPRHAGAVEPELMVAGRLQVSGGPPWSPAPKPPGLADYGTMPWLALPGPVPGNGSVSRAIPPGPRPSPYSRSTFCATDMTGPGPGHLSSAQIAAASAASGIRAGAHRRVRHQGAHRAGISTSRARGPAGRIGRHRATVH
jgi:hypothetical protein